MGYQFAWLISALVMLGYLFADRVMWSSVADGGAIRKALKFNAFGSVLFLGVSSLLWVSNETASWPLAESKQPHVFTVTQTASPTINLIPTEKPTKEVLTTDEAATEAGVNADTIRRWIAGGKLTAEKDAGVWRIRRASLESTLGVHDSSTIDARGEL